MAHPDFDELLNALIPFAQEMLAKRGEFYPFGSSMTSDGRIIMNAAYDGDEQPSSQELIDLMTRAFQKSAAAGEIRAAGICYDICTVSPGTMKKCDAICLSLEHKSGDAVDVFVPYQKRWLRGIRYGELFAGARTPEFFV